MMQAEHINPFIDGVVNAFETMLDCKAQRGTLGLANVNQRTYPISGVIGLSGRAAGTVVINLSEQLALKSASVMLMTDYKELNDDVVDAVGELANVVAGQAKAELEEYELSISLPSVVIGAGHEIRFPSDARPISVPFETDFGPMILEVGLEPIVTPTGV